MIEDYFAIVFMWILGIAFVVFNTDHISDVFIWLKGDFYGNGSLEK